MIKFMELLNMIDDLLIYIFNSVVDGIVSFMPLNINLKSKKIKTTYLESKKNKTLHQLDKQYKNWKDAMIYIDHDETYIQKINYVLKINNFAISICELSKISNLIHIRKHIYNFILNIKLMDKNDVGNIINKLEQISIEYKNNQDIKQYIKETNHILNH